MKKLVLFIILLFCMAGCSEPLENMQEINVTANSTELTQEKKDFLSTISMDAERVQNGELYEWQEEVLRQYDYAMEYLKKNIHHIHLILHPAIPKGKMKAFQHFGLS